MRALRPLGCEFPLKYTPAPLPIKGKNSSSVSNIGPGLVIKGLVVMVVEKDFMTVSGNVGN